MGMVSKSNGRLQATTGTRLELKFERDREDGARFAILARRFLSVMRSSDSLCRRFIP